MPTVTLPYVQGDGRAVRLGSGSDCERCRHLVSRVRQLCTGLSMLTGQRAAMARSIGELLGVLDGLAVGAECELSRHVRGVVARARAALEQGARGRCMIAGDGNPWRCSGRSRW